MVHVEVLATGELGDRSYVAHDGTTALVVDPQRDVDRVEKVLEGLGLRLAAVAETHIHNDYVTGGLALARSTGADYLVSASDDVSFERRPVSDGDEIGYDGLWVRVLHTPGHTFHHLAYLVGAGPGDTEAVFTGGSLLYGSVGRTDLLGAEHTEVLTRHQFRSARRLDDLLDAATPIYPTHGFGSFCSVGSATGADSSTLGDERRGNDVLRAPDEDTFVEHLLANLTAYPAYYAHMAPLNSRGPGTPDLSPPRHVDAADLRRRIRAGEWVVDLRDRRAYAAGHVHGSVGIELRSDQMSTYLGWLMPWGTPVTLLGADAEQVATAQRQLARIGIDRPAGAATGALEALADRPVAFRRVRFADLAPGVDGVVVDVRQAHERAQASIPGSLHVPIHQVPERAGELPSGETLWVHCASGFRASIAGGLLHRVGHEVVVVDDDFEHAVELGLATP